MGKQLNAMYVINELSTVPKVVGNIITEASKDFAEFVKKAPNRVHLETILLTLDWINRNKRMYEENVFMKALTQDERLNEIVPRGNCWGEVGHPDDASLQRQAKVIQSNSSHIILKMWKEGKNIKGIVRASDIFAHGDSFHNSVINGVIPAFSLRALGGLENTSKGACVRDLKIITFDWVVYPSFKNAYMTNLSNKIVDHNSKALKESCELISITEDAVKSLARESMLDFIKEESRNVKDIMSVLNYLYESQEVSNDGRQMVLSNHSTGEKIFIPLETYVQKQIYDQL